MRRAAKTLIALGSLALLTACGNVYEAADRANPNGAVSGELNPRVADHVDLQERKFTAYITGYSWWDNTPRGSAAIARPVIHRHAGGTGTYDDPVTIAVGHTIVGRVQTLDYPAGTRFYLSHLRKYAIVEDVCGDGHRPQDGPCHSGHRGNPWLDIYVGGKQAGNDNANRCMAKLTGLHDIYINPRRGYPVVTGAIAESGCQTFQG